MSNIAIDFRTLPVNVPSLCIPRVFPNIDERRIRGIFSSLDMGEIEKIDIVPKRTEKGEKFNRVFIHFRRWNIGGNADMARERLINGKEIKIVYEDPWFWKISAYREPTARPSNQTAERPVAVPRLQFDDDSRSSAPKNQDRYYKNDRRNMPRKAELPKQRMPGPKAAIPGPKAALKVVIPEPKADVPELMTPPLVLEQQEYHEEVKTPEPIKIQYGNVPPPPKKLNFKAKKGTAKVIEDGEM